MTDAPRPEVVDVATALRRFLDAFEQLAWDAFCACFADDASAFFPSAATPERFTGRAAVEARFAEVFEQARRAAPSGPRYLELVPEALDIQLPAAGVAIASFVLRSPERLARRTLVFRRDASAWRIVHLHGSNVPWPDAPR